MYYLHSGDYEEAVGRLQHGYEHAPWADIHDYYATALSIALLKKERYEQALAIMNNKIIQFDSIEAYQRQILIAHGRAGMGHKEDATALLDKLKACGNQRIIYLSERLRLKYGLSTDTTLEIIDADIDSDIAKIEAEMLLSLPLAA
jgi:tetratricopeptide (TPR) repeat protein